MWLCTCQDNDVALRQFRKIDDINGVIRGPIQRRELLGFDPVGVTDGKRRVSKRQEMCQYAGSGDARTEHTDTCRRRHAVLPRLLFTDRRIDLTPTTATSRNLRLALHTQNGCGDACDSEHHKHSAQKVHRFDLRGANKNRTCDLILIRDAL